MPLSFNPAPGWPSPPPGWFPAVDWSPDPSWPPMPPGWRVVVLDGAPDAPPPAPPPAPPVAPPAPSAPSAPAGPPAEHRQDLVTSGRIVYDRALLPEGFADRGFQPADRDWWDAAFLAALAAGERERSRAQALVQAEVDRAVAALAAIDARTAPADPERARAERTGRAREAEQVAELVRHVTAVVAENREA